MIDKLIVMLQLRAFWQALGFLAVVVAEALWGIEVEADDLELGVTIVTAAIGGFALDGLTGGLGAILQYAFGRR